MSSHLQTSKQTVWNVLKVKDIIKSVPCAKHSSSLAGRLFASNKVLSVVYSEVGDDDFSQNRLVNFPMGSSGQMRIHTL